MGRIYTCLSVCGGSLTDGRDMDTDNRQTDRQTDNLSFILFCIFMTRCVEYL